MFRVIPSKSLQNLLFDGAAAPRPSSRGGPRCSDGWCDGIINVLKNVLRPGDRCAKSLLYDMITSDTHHSKCDSLSLGTRDIITRKTISVTRYTNQCHHSKYEPTVTRNTIAANFYWVSLGIRIRCHSVYVDSHLQTAGNMRGSKS